MTLTKAGLRCLNEATASIMAVMLWKSKQEMNPLGVCIFSEKTHKKYTHLAESNKVSPTVPGFHTLPSNIMTRIWNSVPELQTATTLGKAKSIARLWARTIPR